MKLAADYDRWYEWAIAKGGEASDEDAPWYRLVLEYLPPMEGKRVLEIACGRGGFALALASRGAWVCGSDFSFTALRFARERLRDPTKEVPGVCLAQTDAHHLPYKDKSFEIVVSCETIEHLTDPVGALREMARVCRPRGHLFLTTPNYANLTGAHSLYRSLRGKRAKSNSDQPYDRRYLFFQVRGFLAKAGWDIIRSDGTVHQIMLPNRDPVVLPFLESKPMVRRMLSVVALHYLVVAQKREGAR